MLKVHQVSYAPALGLKPIVFQWSYAFQPGKFYVLQGENGTGKTTILKLLAGLYRNDEGDIEWQGDSIRQDLSFYQSQVMWLGHQLGLNAALTKQETLAWASAIFESNRSNDDLQFFLNFLTLEPSPLGASPQSILARTPDPRPAQWVGSCSAGQQRRLALARLWLSDRAIYLLDEPTMNLDARAIQQVEYRLQVLLQRGALIIVSTHQALKMQCSMITLKPEDWGYR